MTPSQLERFEQKYVPVPYCGCWLWDGSSDTNGYGVLWADGKQHQAHRLSYSHYKQPIPRGLVVRHTCDVRCCVNPDHLSVGTQKQNVHDMIERGRSVRGEQSPKAVLTGSQVREIRRLRGVVFQRELAERFGVTRQAISDIHTNRTWAWMAPNK